MPRKKHSDTPVAKPRLRHGETWLCLTASLLVAACSPALDWRNVPLPDTQFVASLPCKPARFERQVTVANVPVKLFMLSCDAEGVTYGVATAEVGDPTRIDAVLRALRESARASIRSAEVSARALNVQGSTPFAENSSAIFHGQRPDGQRVDESIRVFARGTRVFQASAIGAALPAVALAPFEDGLRFDLEKPAADPS